MSRIQQNCHWGSYYYVHLLISEYLPRDRQITLAHVNNKTVYFTWKFCFSLLSNKYISNISNLYNHVTICFQIWSRTIIFIFFWLRTLIIFCFFLYVVIVQLLWIWEGERIYCKFTPDWIESTPARILFTSQYRTKFEILPGEVFRK